MNYVVHTKDGEVIKVGSTFSGTTDEIIIGQSVVSNIDLNCVQVSKFNETIPINFTNISQVSGVINIEFLAKDQNCDNGDVNSSDMLVGKNTTINLKDCDITRHDLLWLDF